jgi:hypothetical protein
VSRFHLRTVRSALQNERGAVAIIVAIFLVGLLVIAALVLDLGTGYDHDLELQHAADAGALAGAQQLILDDLNGTSDAAAVTQQYVAQNVSPGDAGSTVQGANVTYSPTFAARSVSVDLREDHVPFNFAQIIGISQGSVTAHAKAELMYLTGTPVASPVAIPFLRPPRFIMDVDGHFGDMTDPAYGTDGDTGVYTGSSSTSGGSGLHFIFLGARDENNKDLLAPDLVGSVYVPSSGSNYRSVDINRSHGSGSESVTVTVVYTGTQPLTQLYLWKFSSSFLGLPIWGSTAFPVTEVGTSTTYTGTVTATPGYYMPNFESLVGIATGPSSSFGVFPAAQPDLACWGIFSPGGSIEYFDQSHYSGAGSVTGTVKTHAFHMGSSIMVNTADTVFQNTFGSTGWGDMFSGATFTQEVEASVGLIAPGSGWRLRPDTENGGDGNGSADIGEAIPVASGIRSAAGWGTGLIEALNSGKPITVTLVAPAYTGSQWHTNWWFEIGTWWDFIRQFWPSNNTPPATVPIVGFGALQLSSVQLSGTNALISGTFTRWLDPGGGWTNVKPKNGIYVETAVLTE